MALYLACVASIDDNLGRVIDWLRGRDGWFDKRFMCEESLHMPLVLSYPRQVAEGQVHEGIVTNVHFARSILDASVTDVHPRMQGRSF